MEFNRNKISMLLNKLSSNCCWNFIGTKIQKHFTSIHSFQIFKNIFIFFVSEETFKWLLLTKWTGWDRTLVIMDFWVFWLLLPSSHFLSLCLSVFLSLCSLPLCLSASLSLCLSASLSLCLSVSLSFCLAASLSLSPSVFQSICLFVSLFLCLPVFLSLCLSVSLLCLTAILPIVFFLPCFFFARTSINYFLFYLFLFGPHYHFFFLFLLLNLFWNIFLSFFLSFFLPLCSFSTDNPLPAKYWK
jgi:hypothetical protein